MSPTADPASAAAGSGCQVDVHGALHTQQATQGYVKMYSKHRLDMAYPNNRSSAVANNLAGHSCNVEKNLLEDFLYICDFVSQRCVDS